MKVLIACEFSGITRRAFEARGHDAWSCDLRNSLDNSPKHIKDDIFNVIDPSFDLMIAHPPCTHLASSGSSHFWYKKPLQEQATEFVRKLWDSPIGRIAIENPIGVLSNSWKKPDQFIQPWQFGHEESKKTCLWLKNLLFLKPTKIMKSRHSRINKIGTRTRNGEILRSMSYTGIAEAMAFQWDPVEMKKECYYIATGKRLE